MDPQNDPSYKDPKTGPQFLETSMIHILAHPLGCLVSAVDGIAQNSGGAVWQGLPSRAWGRSIKGI